MSTVAVTGATGLVGRQLVTHLARCADVRVRAAVRRPSPALPGGVEQVTVGDFSATTDWHRVLAGAETVVHAAARVHVMRDTHPDPLAEFRRVNVAATLRLAREAAAAGVARLVYLSSVKVCGDVGTHSETGTPAPEDHYGRSKHEAEVGLRAVAAETGLDVVIIRPPLVYGPGATANFRALMRAVSRGIPLPLGAIHNRRSLVALDNLVDFIVLCTTHPAAKNETFFVSDGEDLSTTDLIRRLARAMGRPSRLVPVPAAVLIAAAAVLGRRDLARRLIASQQVDISKARRLLGWVPPISVDEGLRRAVRSTR